MVVDIYNRSWIIEHAKQILEEYPGGITIRQLHYRLVSIGMINDLNHYKRVVKAMTDARWDSIIDMDAFIDRERSMYGETEDDELDVDEEIQRAKDAIKLWMRSYHLKNWSNQNNYVEIWIEKKALQGVFENPCRRWDVGLAPCKGYPSITFLWEAKPRFQDAMNHGKHPVILYFGDYDPSGEDIPRSVEENLGRMGITVEVRRIALNQDQIQEMHLPGVPPKINDTRTKNWSGGSVVELDAIEPRILAKMCEDAIKQLFDEDLHAELEEKEREERSMYQAALKDFVNTLKDDE